MQRGPAPSGKDASVAAEDSLKPSEADTTVSRIMPASITREDLVAFAISLKGIPYHEAGANPDIGFDCSGFITYVFHHFALIVPRSSVDFTNYGKEISLHAAQKGDLILFTGTDSTVRIVGHMGIVTENTDSLRFIHSTSGRQYGVTVTALNEYYRRRFVKVIDVF